MASRLQKKLAKEIVKDLRNKRPRTGGNLLESVGYAKTTALKAPGRSLESKGVKDELVVLGFSVSEADGVVSTILHKGKKDENKLKAADMVYKRLGGYKPTALEHTFKPFDISDEDREKIDRLMNETD